MSALSVFAGHAVSATPRDTNIILKDPRAFKAICYSGYRDGQGPGSAEPSEAQVREDLTLLKNYTHEIRTYGSGKGSHGSLVPKIADELGLSVHLGVWVDNTYDEAVNIAAVNDAIALLKENHRSIKSVIVGNEFMLRVRHPELTAKPNVKPDPAVEEGRLINYIKLVKAAVPKGVEVTTADTWAEVRANSDALLGQLDYVIWHAHPWWENQDIAGAGAYVATRQQVIQDRVAKIGGKRLVLGETGWPTRATNGPAVGSPENQARYFKELTIWGFENYSEFWSFTSFDESWKDAEGEVGGHWGLWNSNRQPLPVISGLDTLYPKYMWSENPANATTAVSGPRIRISPGLSASRPIDALGRAVDNLSLRRRAPAVVLLAR